MLYYFRTPHIHKLEGFIMVYLSRVDISIAFKFCPFPGTEQRLGNLWAYNDGTRWCPSDVNVGL